MAELKRSLVEKIQKQQQEIKNLQAMIYMKDWYIQYLAEHWLPAVEAPSFSQWLEENNIPTTGEFEDDQD